MFKFEVIVLTEEEFKRIPLREQWMIPCIIVGESPLSCRIEKDRYGYFDVLSESRCEYD